MNIENTADIKPKSTSPAQKSSAEASFCLSNQALHKALKILSGVVDHSQVIQILGYIKCDLSKDRLSLIASNSEIEIHVSIPVIDNPSDESCTFTLPCRKLFDITRSLDTDVVLRVKHMQSWAEISVGKTRFKLASLPANNFPQLAQFTPQNLDVVAVGSRAGSGATTPPTCTWLVRSTCRRPAITSGPRSSTFATRRSSGSRRRGSRWFV